MKRWLEFLIAGLMTGCVSSPQQPDQIKTVPPAVQQKVPDVDPDQVFTDSLAKPIEVETSIEPTVLYLLLAAELAGQRNQFGIALDGYLQAAKLVNDARIAERAARIGLYIRDTERTDEAVQLWLKQDSQSMMARKFAALSAIRRGNKAQALEHLNATLKLDPAGFEGNLLELNNLLSKDGKERFIYELLEQMEQENANQPALFFVQAVLASKMRQNELAWQKNAKALALQPQWTKALVLQAQLAGRAGRFAEATSLLESALQHSPDDMRIRKMLAQAYVDKGEHEAAVNLYREVLTKRPTDGESLFAIALLHLQQEQSEEAERYLLKLVKDPAWSSQASYYLGRISIEREQWDQALAWLDKVQDGVFLFDARSNVISLLIEQARYDAAQHRLNELEQQFPQQKIRIQLLRSDLYSRSGEFQKAFDMLSEALQQDNDNRDLLYARALIAERLGRLDLLESDLLKILQDNPEDVGALNALGYTLADRTDRYEEAEKYLSQAFELQPEEAVIIDSYGWLQYKLGKKQEALQYIQQAYEKLPENEIVVHLAEILWHLGQQDKAQQLIELALEKAPDDRFLLEFKSRFFK